MSRSAEFPLSVKDSVIRRGVCAECGCGEDKEDPWHVHHIIFLSSVIARELPKYILKSEANGMLLHRSCHHHLHNMYDEPPQRDIDEVLAKTGVPMRLGLGD